MRTLTSWFPTVSTTASSFSDCYTHFQTEALALSQPLGSPALGGATDVEAKSCSYPAVNPSISAHP